MILLISDSSTQCLLIKHLQMCVLVIYDYFGKINEFDILKT